jgi:hypothetical protein
MRFCKYGFLTSLSAFLAFLATENPGLRPVLIYLWIGVTFIGIITCFWKTVENTEEGMLINHLLSNFQKLENIIILTLITAAVMIGIS